MGFFGATTKNKKQNGPSPELMHRLQCKVCPLDKIKSNQHPHMKPTGATHPVIYMIGEAPGKQEDEEGEQFVGASGQLLRTHIPREWHDKIRWNNVVRTRPRDNATPDEIAIECCRPSVEADIVATKPRVIFGFGNIPLHWAAKCDGITNWRGRRMPVNIGGHECWYYAFMHPAALLRKRHNQRDTRHIGSEDERAFVFDLKRAFAELDHLPPAKVHTLKMVGKDIELIFGAPGDLKYLERMLKWAAEQETVGVDYETKNIRPYAEDSKILTIAVGTEECSFAFAYQHRQAQWSPDDLKRVKILWIKFLKSQTRKAVHFLRFELEWSAFFFGWELVYAPGWHGTESQASVLDDRVGSKDKDGPLSLKFLVQQHFGFDLKALSNTLNKGNLDAEPLKDVLWYNAADAKYHCLLFLAQEAYIKALSFEHLYQEMLERVPTTVLTQLKGIPINQKVTAKLANKYEAEIAKILALITKEPEIAKFKAKFNHDFKPLSDDDCVRLFRDMLKRKEGYRGTYDNGDIRYSTDEKVLLQIDIPLAKLILGLRKATKKLSTYIYRNNKNKTIIWPDSKLHPNFNTVFVRTKRLSSDDPNFQNVPKRHEDAKEVRAQIEAPEDHLLVSVDYGQIQARGIAIESKDAAFSNALWERFDVHGHWAERIAYAYPARIGGKQYLKDKAVLKKFRNDPIKSGWTFGLFFGCSLATAAEYCKIPEAALKPELKAFQKMFAGVFEWHERLEKFYHEHGYVEDSFGFRHFAPLSYNQMINSPIQSLEALFVMRGMNRLSQHANATGDYYYQPNAQIHDDLTSILPKKDIDHYVDKKVTEMLAVTFSFVNVPITVEVSVGRNLMHMEEVLVASSDDWKVGK